MRNNRLPGAGNRNNRGFTLIEVIIVIVITGIIAVMCAIFIKTSFDSYFASVRRAEMVEVADTAVQLLVREIRLAVPNSLRINDTSNSGACTAGTCYIEFVPTKSGGRYRNAGDGSSRGNFMCDGATAGATNTMFDIYIGQALAVGVIPVPTYANGDYIVVDNDASLTSSGTPSNIYGGGSRAVISSATNASPVTISSAFGNGNIICSYLNNRFQVVDKNTQAVTYACPKTSAASSISRYAAYGFNAVQPNAAPGGSVSTVAGSATYPATCQVSYNQNVQERNGLLYFQVTISNSSGESVTVFRQIHVDNSP
jgi:MSHA biogenesis protein MshO